LNIVYEINIIDKAALFYSVLGDLNSSLCLCFYDSFDCKWEHGMSYLTRSDFSIEGLVTVLGIDEGDFILPPHECIPIILTILEELPEVIRVLAESTNDTFIWSLLVPFQTLEGK